MKRFLAYASIFATLIFLVTAVALLFLAPDMDPMRFGISFYALNGYALLIGLALSMIGVSGILLAVALWPATVSFAARIGLVLLIAWGVTSILAGVFPLDDPDAAPTLSGSIHNMAGLNFLLIAIAVPLIDLPSASAVDPTRSRPKTTWLAWLVLVFAALLFIFNGPLASTGIGGLIQRLYWLVLAFWLLFKARQILQVVRTPSGVGVQPSWR
jgi:hypothetical protein